MDDADVVAAVDLYFLLGASLWAPEDLDPLPEEELGVSAHG